MSLDAGALLADAARDPAYPTVSPVDRLYPCHCRAPLASPLDGVATPAIWSRLAEPLRRALELAWVELGLRAAGRPELWLGLHYGRIALNAHAWERLGAAAQGRAADPALVVPGSGLARLADRWEAGRARRRTGRLEQRLTLAAERRDASVRALAAREPAELDPAEIARGPLDESRWTEVLLPTLRAPLLEDAPPPDADPVLGAALALEQRWSGELGRWLAARGVLSAAAYVAYLTVPERIRALHEPGVSWSALAESRARRVEKLARVDVPDTFWGRPRVDGDVAPAICYDSEPG